MRGKAKKAEKSERSSSLASEASPSIVNLATTIFPAFLHLLLPNIFCTFSSLAERQSALRGRKRQKFLVTLSSILAEKSFSTLDVF
jgi:hypothetical protein